MPLTTRSWFRKLFARPTVRPPRRPRLVGLEALEDRYCPAPLTSYGGPLLANVQIAPGYLKVSQPTGSSASPSGYSPAQMRHAYGFDQITFTNASGAIVKGDGSGQTIAVIDAYDDPNIAADLTVFDQQFGLADPPSFTKVGIDASGNPSTTQFPRPDSGWAGEIALDVESAHSFAPAANILLVEAISANTADLYNGVDYARNQPGVVAVSMSFGGSEDGTEPQFESHFTTPTGHGGVTFLASSGDSGAGAQGPADSPHVVAVGGTSLALDAQGNYKGEGGWSSGGGGLSTSFKQPSYQQGLTIHNGTTVISANGMRAIPDVASVADPNTGVAVYDTYGGSGWAEYGGTSVSAPQWAGLMAVVAQGRVLAGGSSLDSFTQTLPALYQLPAADFHDITTGSNGFNAGPGYDLVTGLGSPVANRLVPDLAGLMDYAASTGPNAFVLKQNGSNLQLYDNGTLVRTLPLAVSTEVTITGSANTDNTLTIDYSGGVFNVPVTFDGGAGTGSHRLFVDDSGDTTARTVSAGNGSITGLGGATHYNTADLGALTVVGGSGGNTLIMNGALPAATVFDGGAGSNTLVGPGGAATWTISGANQGSVAGVSFAHFADLRSGAGANRFAIQPGGSEARIDGGGGTNTLDFSAFPSPVSAPLSGPGSSHGFQGAAAPEVAFFDNIDGFVNVLATLTAGGVNVSATAGAPFSGTVATFTPPLGTAASYSAVIDWGDSSTSAGVISGTGTLTVSGTHTYADPVNETVHVTISHNLGYTTTATTTATATVTGLGQAVGDGQTATAGFWHRDRGQDLIASFNGGATHTELSAWLATNFPNLYGAAGDHDLTGMTNAQVAAFFQGLFRSHHDQPDVEVLATALNVYATTAALGGAQGAAYGFRVTAQGLGASSFNADEAGAAFGVANDSTLNVYQLLRRANDRAVGGVLYNGDAHLRDLAEDLFDALNHAGEFDG